MRNLHSFVNFFIFSILMFFWCFVNGSWMIFADDNCRKLFLLASQKFGAFYKFCGYLSENTLQLCGASNKSSWNQQNTHKTMKPSQSPTEISWISSAKFAICFTKLWNCAPTIAAVKRSELMDITKGNVELMLHNNASKWKLLDCRHK